MRKSIAWATPAAVISVAALTALALDRHLSVISQAQAEDLKAADSEALCPRGDATLRGTYMSKGEGTAVGVGPVAFIGTVYFDGNVMNRTSPALVAEFHQGWGWFSAMS